MAAPDFSTNSTAPDLDDDPENKRIFDEWRAEKRDALVAAACRFVEGCNAGPYGLARLPGGHQVAAVGTPEQIRVLLDEIERPRPTEDA